MSEFNSILTDRELRDLLQQYLLEQDQDNVLTEQMIEMESKMVFGTAPALAVVMPNETEMIGKLTKSFAGKSSLYAWTIGLGLSAAVGLGIYTFTGNGSEKNAAPSIEKNTTPVKENAIPDAPPHQSPETPPTNNAGYLVNHVEKKHETENENPGNPQEINREEERKTDPLWTYTSPDPVKTDEVKKETAETGKEKKKSNEKPYKSIDTVFTGVKKIVVNAGICNLGVSKSSSNKVSLKGGIAVETKGLVTKKPEYEIKYEKKDDVLKVWVEQEKECSVIAGSINIDASLNLEVPSGTDVDLSANSNINLSELDGRLCKVSSGYGNISATRINTGFNFSATSGNITIADCVGGAELNSTYGDISANNHKGNMTIKSASGNITVNGLTGDHVDIKVAYGNIQLSNIEGLVSLTSSSGDVHVDHAKGNMSIQSTYGNQTLRTISGNLSTTSTSGDVRIEELKGDLEVRSTYGNVNANNCKGNIMVKSQSGDIKGKNIQVLDALELTATYGDIKMQLDNPLNDLSFDLMAISGDVSVKKDGTNIKGDEGKLHLEKGKIRVKGTTTSGDQVYE